MKYNSITGDKNIQKGKDIKKQIYHNYFMTEAFQSPFKLNSTPK